MNEQSSLPDHDRSTADAAWSSMSYLLGGMAVWGGAGWLLDRALGTSPAFLSGGVLLGVAAALYLVVVRFLRP